MKLLYFVDGMQYKGGIARIICDKINFLTEYLNYDVSLCTLNNNLESTYPLSPKVKLITTSIISDQNNLKGKIKQIIFSVSKIKNIIEREKPDIIINANAKIITWVLPYIKRKIPKILEIHFSKPGMKLNIKDKSFLFLNMYTGTLLNILI